MTIKVGDKLPNVTFMTWGENGPEPVTTEQVFAGKHVVLFAVPGAYTPTCSAQHLPGFKKRVDDFKGKDIDIIACTSVNDVFVMHAWAENEGIGDEILFLADGNGEFAKACGLEMDAMGFGMGIRSQRYAMDIHNQEVIGMYVEEMGEYKVSSADNVLSHL